MIGVGKDRPYINISDIIDVESYEKLDSKIVNDLIYCLNNDELFANHIGTEHINEKLTIDNTLRVCKNREP